MRVVDFAVALAPYALRVLLALVFAASVGVFVGMVLHVVTTAGPNCPAPVPAEWQGFCDAYDGQ